MDTGDIERVREDFKFLFDDVLGIVVYGSAARGEENERSDVDICIIAPDRDGADIFKKTLSLNYDIKIFEEAPLYLKIEIIENHEIVYTKDVYELYEYFYHYRKVWKDQEHRQRLSGEDALHMFS